MSSYHSYHFIPQIPMGKIVRSNTNEITLQMSFIFHIYFIVWLNHTQQYYVLIKIVWYHNFLCSIHLIEFFIENKTNSIFSCILMKKIYIYRNILSLNHWSICFMKISSHRLIEAIAKCAMYIYHHISSKLILVFQK